MVRDESKWEALLSWADEVEKEEEVAAAAAVATATAQQKQKSDPFAFARPREVVLQEKGIDWRKLDTNLEQPSRISHFHFNCPPSHIREKQKDLHFMDQMGFTGMNLRMRG
ncbi:hypothetical protein SLE2022_242650 [Rubroshorea leprosula]